MHGFRLGFGKMEGKVNQNVVFYGLRKKKRIIKLDHRI